MSPPGHRHMSRHEDKIQVSVAKASPGSVPGSFKKRVLFEGDGWPMYSST